MAKISTPQRIIKDGVKEDFYPVIDNIGPAFNSFTDDIYNAMNKNITVEDNLNMQYKSLDIVITATGKPKALTQFKSTIATKSQGLTVIKAINNTNINTFPTGAPFITYSENDKLITIQHVTGLVPENKYTLTILNLG